MTRFFRGVVTGQVLTLTASSRASNRPVIDIRKEGAQIEEWRETVITAIEATRPVDEAWKVTASEVTKGVLNLDFARGTVRLTPSHRRWPAAR